MNRVRGLTHRSIRVVAYDFILAYVVLVSSDIIQLYDTSQRLPRSTFAIILLQFIVLLGSIEIK